ncbi:binding-protein-dependent transport systems inner membrane component [Dickeya chrysanthemi Ech1591]|uniref:Binding-protein-dependent transport systems inner membrane component n=1 Tax=Dickeya chrysanthemi (strain Ech1591) TaxID=561229 RepID=C6CHN7_DICC1|nr:MULTISPECIES: ABC transporter permease [Dickeya]ACT06938.1 binding-protein-dependent transport systems inner membrane component [Dickeya chrysanthemi Ech1591]TYL44477.1 ABC transporter permease [Dickeya sp. ws52]WJM86576.1 ABC transporter permease [Dickeya chrysanthemi]
MQQTAVNRLNRLLVALFLLLGCVWFILPFAMAVLWSLVDPAHPWAYPDVFPPVLSLLRWRDLWNNTSLPDALLHSYLLAPLVTLTCLLLAMPTAYALGRLSFPGKGVAQVLTLLPIVLPGFVVAVFFSSLLMQLGIYSRFLGIFLGHTVLFLPYAIRIMSVSFSQVRQDLIDAARNMRASRWRVFRVAYWPSLQSGAMASMIMVFILSIEEFSVSYIVGAPDFITVPTILYSYLGYNFIRPNAAVVSLILVLPNVVLMLLMERCLKHVPTSAFVNKG